MRCQHLRVMRCINRCARSFVHRMRVGLLGLMPAYRSGEHGAFGMKAICVFPENPSQGKDAHQGAVMLFSRETGELLALMNASEITAIRTAAVSAVGHSLTCSRRCTAIWQSSARVSRLVHTWRRLSHVRAIKRARVVARNFDHAQQFAREEAQPQYPFPIEAVRNNEEAVRGADLIVTATSSLEPVINKDWISPGAHINAIGTHSPSSREIDSATMAATRIFVDRRESALNESGDYLIGSERRRCHSGKHCWRDRRVINWNKIRSHFGN